MTDSASTWFNNEATVLNIVNPSVAILPRGVDYIQGDVAYVKGLAVLLDSHFYNTIYLEREHFKLTPQEFADQILERQLRAIAELIVDAELGAKAKYVVYAAPKPKGACSGYITRGTINYRWYIHNDEYGAPVSTVDVLFGSSK